MTPPVLVLGAQRSATTFLYRALDAHPRVSMARPERPEPKWFLTPAAEGATAAQWRDALFPSTVSGDTVLGEKSTSYLESDVAARRIATTLPDARLVVSLRDPVERALSNYRFSVLNRVETRDPATALLGEVDADWDRERFSVSPYDYLGRSRYVEHLARWQDVAGSLHVVLAEQVVAEDAAVARLVADLGLSPAGHRLAPTTRVNAAGGSDLPDRIRAGVRERLAESTAALVDQWDLPFRDWWPSVAA